MRIRTGAFKGRSLAGPGRGRARPTQDRVRLALLNVLRPWISGARFLDLYAGTGSVGLAALSEGAAQVVWVEASARIVRVARTNVRRLAPHARGDVVVADGRAYATRARDFDIVFADPPYDLPPGPIVEAVLGGHCLVPGGRFVLEHSARVVAPAAPEGSTLVWTRRYGDAALSLYLRVDGASPDRSPESADGRPRRDPRPLRGTHPMADGADDRHRA